MRNMYLYSNYHATYNYKWSNFVYQVKKQVLAIKAERDVEEKERRFEERLIKQIAAEARRKENQEDLARFQQRVSFTVV